MNLINTIMNKKVEKKETKPSAKKEETKAGDKKTVMAKMNKSDAKNTQKKK